MNKDTEQIVNSIIEETVTTNRVYQFINALDALSNELYSYGTDVTNVINKYFPLSATNDNKINELNSLLKNKNNKEAIELITNIKDRLKKIQNTKVTIAFEPNLNYLKELENNISKFLNKKTLLDITIDPNILGGIIIVDEGKYIDLSIRRHLDTYFYDNKQQIVKMYSDTQE